MRDHAIKELEKLAEHDEDIILMNGDLGFSVLDDFHDKYPDRWINAGICEQNMMGVAAGIALTGKKVFVYSIGNFPAMRCLEQIRNDVCYNKTDVKILAVGGGFSYGQLGMSHHATEDYAIMRALPEMRVYSPADSIDAVNAIDEVYNTKGPCYIRLAKNKEPILDRMEYYGKFVQKIKDGGEIAVLSTGPVIDEAIKAAEKLKNENNTDISVFNIVQLKPVPDIVYEEIIRNYKLIITIEEHNVIGGLGSAISDEITKNNNNCKLIKMGLNDEYTSIVGSQAYLRKYYGLSNDDIVKIVKAYQTSVN